MISNHIAEQYRLYGLMRGLHRRLKSLIEIDKKHPIYELDDEIDSVKKEIEKYHYELLSLKEKI
jgi:hypothetical protein